MRKILQLFKDHWLAIIFYLIYCYALYSTFMAGRQYKHELEIMNSGGKAVSGNREGAPWDCILFCIMFIVSLINASRLEEQRKFYYWLIFFIIMAFVILEVFCNIYL
jgi:hypothetical protein